MTHLKLAIGPHLFGWPEKSVRALYLKLAGMAEVQTLYLGEVVCSKRIVSDSTWMIELAGEIAAMGKEVVLSTLAMPTEDHELEHNCSLIQAASEHGWLVEANDLSSVAFAADAGIGFVGGPHLNIYHRGTLDYLHGKGMKRMVLPLEMAAEKIPGITRNSPVEIEYFAHGKMPLTFSARCYTARAMGLSKADCRRVCFRSPEGIQMNTLEGESFGTINGIQMMSEKPFTVLDRVAELPALGIDMLRLSPQADGTEQIVRAFAHACNGETTGTRALAAMNKTGGFCNGYFHGRQGRVWID